jgi:hypothetical protein
MKPDQLKTDGAAAVSSTPLLGDVVKELESQYDEWWWQAEYEKAVGHNCVKEALYRGTATGIKIALDVIREKSPNDKVSDGR